MHPPALIRAIRIRHRRVIRHPTGILQALYIFQPAIIQSRLLISNCCAMRRDHSLHTTSQRHRASILTRHGRSRCVIATRNTFARILQAGMQTVFHHLAIITFNAAYLLHPALIQTIGPGIIRPAHISHGSLVHIHLSRHQLIQSFLQLTDFHL